MSLSSPTLSPMDVNFNVPSNPNGLNSCSDETIEFGILGNHGRTTLLNHALFSHNSVNCAFTNHAGQDRGLTDSMLISSNHINYDFGNHRNYGNFPTHVKQEPDLVTSAFPSYSHPRSFSSCSSSPLSFKSSQNSMFSSQSSFTHQLDLGQQMAQQRKRNILSLPSPRVHIENLIDYFPIQNNPHLTCVSVTETVRRQYMATIPTSRVISVQNDIKRVRRALACESTIWNSPPHHTNLSHNIFHDQNVDHEYVDFGEVMNPKPLNIIFPEYEADQSRHLWHQMENLDNFSSTAYPNSVHQESLSHFPSSNNHDNQNCGQDGQLKPYNLVKRSRKPKRSVENIMEYLFTESDEDDNYDGRTHSLPYEKYGPYTCPKCNNVFDTSQKFAAHMVSVHYKNETSEEKRKRLRARYRKRFRLLNPDAIGVKNGSLERPMVKPNCQMINSGFEREEEEEEEEAEEGRVSKEGCGTSNSEGGEGDEDSPLIDVVVKQELM